ncbi:permease [Chloroflexota bacterium]
MKRGKIVRAVLILAYIVFLAVSWTVDFTPGKEISRNFASFALEMLKIMPCVFILIGLFEVWIKTETVEKHLGEGSGIRGYLWGVLLAGTTVGGLYIAFPIAYSLYNKGARLGVIFTYIGASAICRIPMAIFEASFLGIKFTLIRLLVSLPLVIVTSMLLGKYLARRDFKITEAK